MVYVDTSVVVALLTLEPKTRAVTDWFAELKDTPVCADWLLAEFSSAIAIKLRVGQFSEANARRAHMEFAALLEGGARLTPVSRSAFRAASELAEQYRYGLRAGDALHLAVALELGAADMATLDTTLAANAKRKGLRLVDF